MRNAKIVFAVLFAGSFAMPANAVPVCLETGEGQAFDIIGLKSTLMVDALSCGMAKNYDSFMLRFQPQILDSQHMMDDFFIRAGGLAGSAMEDSFTTVLANDESDAAANQGSRYCGTAAKQFAEVAALGDTMDLLNFAAGLNLAAPPDASGICPAAPTAPPLVVASAAPPRPKPAPGVVVVQQLPPVTRVAMAQKRPAVPRVVVAQKPLASPPKPVPPPYMMAQMI